LERSPEIQPIDSNEVAGIAEVAEVAGIGETVAPVAPPRDRLSRPGRSTTSSHLPGGRVFTPFHQRETPSHILEGKKTARRK